ncbi:MAG: DUF2333 family protein [Desulfobaccales bacterium]
MMANPEPQPERRLPVPLPPETPVPDTGKLKTLLRYRFFLVTLVILIFLGGLFFWGTFHKGHPPAPTEATQAEKPAVAPPVAEPGHGPAPEAAPEIGPKAHTPPPLIAPPRHEPLKGEIFTRALIKIMDDQVNKTIFGWRPNSIIFGKFGLTDNVNNTQLGVLDVVIRTVLVLNENMTRFAVTEAYDPHIKEARDFFMVSPDKYWFPSASGKYREALGDLEKYIDSLRKGRSRFYTRVDNLIALFATYKDLLGSSYYNLLKDTQADGSKVSWWVVDDYFYHAKGLALGMSEMLEAVKEEFHSELQKKGSHKLLEDAIHALHTASHLSPWMVTNGSKDGILANHRANMSTYIGEAEHVVATLQTVLATN